MSQVQIIQNPELLAPLVKRWAREAHGEPLGVQVDPAMVMGDVAAMVASPSADMLGLIADGLCVGMLGLQRFRSPTGGQWMANEHYFYVAKEYRGVAAVRLLKSAWDWARQHGCSHLLISASYLAGDGDRVSKLYERLGAKPFERTFIAEVN